ncbi:MAG TPA: hypothetical protein VJN70_21690 [Gemmatimonadaceae bacterium]|nr:hypothetical protein [Gemmatimonadaceae bacterium]
MARVVFLVALLCIVSRPVRAQAPQGTERDSLRTHVLRTRDGSTLIGRIVAESADTVRFESNGALLAIARSQIADLRTIEPGQLRQGEYWFPDPNRTRLFFAPTARMLAQGEGYFSDSYLLLLTVAGGVTSRFTMGGGLSIIPSTNPQNNIFYLTPKVGLIEEPHFGLAAGALVGFAGFEGIEDKDRSFGILYGVGSVGSSDDHLDFGAGWGYAGGRVSGDPAIMIGGATRVSRRVSLLTENYFVPSVSDNALVSYGLRFFGEKLSVDLAFANAVGPHTTFLFPGVPYIAFALKF